MDRGARAGGGGGGDWGQMNLLEEHAGAWAAGVAVETRSEGAASVATGVGERVLDVSYWTI